MSKRAWWSATVVPFLLVLLVLGVGCSRKPKPAVVPATMEPKATTEVVAPPETKPEVVTPVLELKDVFFDYDRFALRNDARDTLTGNGKLLVDNPGTQLVLEGHCDERGTVEYNLALGERRANAVKGFLVQYGVDASRLRTISYGEERPFVMGQDETAWSQNRRVHFVKQ